MYTRTQSQGWSGAQAASGATDWHALEVQLNRTRTILQEILVHLQEVLRNLKLSRSAAMGFGAASRAQTGFTGHRSQDSRTAAGAAGARFRTQTGHQSQSARTDRSQSPPHGGPQAATAGPTGPAGSSDRFRTRPRQGGFEARTETTGQTRTGTSFDRTRAEGGRTTFDRTRTESGRTSFERAKTEGSRTTFRTGAASSGRERPRTENTWRAKASTTAGPERETRSGSNATSGASQRPNASQRPTAGKTAGRPQAAGFHPDQERQHRAREVARKNGMNLKCAYDILCLDYPCSADEIKLAYRQMARLHHPDLGGDEEAMKDVNVAYEMAMRFCAGPRRASAAWAV